MLGTVWRFLSPRGALGRGAYAANLAVIAILTSFDLATASAWPDAGGVCLLLLLVLAWAFIATLAKRLVDAGRSRAWILTPIVFGFIAFVVGFLHFNPADVVGDMDAYGKSLFFASIFPIVAVGIAYLADKFVFGLVAAALVWCAFAAIIGLPGSRKKLNRSANQAP
jgi:uncharacterized membrane protein YhaH (DUF805 family)